jgi:metal-responsive CopG/Arc/MetJ family transcriptional regulator
LIKKFIAKYNNNNEKNKKLKITIEIIYNNTNKKLIELYNIFRKLYNKQLISDIISIKKKKEKD